MTTTTTTTATYTKLRDGSWGVRAPAGVTVGQTITVVKKSGESKTETIAHVVWEGNGVALCKIEPTARSTSTSRPVVRSSSSGRCRGCRGPIVNASHHRAMEGYCGGCAFDEFDC